MEDNQEGYVVRDDNWNRVKVKNPTYFLAHHLANNGKPDFLNIYLNGDVSEFLNYFPQYKPELNNIRVIFNNVEQEAEIYKENTSLFWDLARKDFVMSIEVPYVFNSFVFKCYENHKLTWQDFVKGWDYFKWKSFFKKCELV